MIHKLSSASEQKKNINDFDKFYRYMRDVGLRYNHSVEVVQVEIISVSEDNSDEGDTELTKAEKKAAKKEAKQAKKEEKKKQKKAPVKTARPLLS